MVGGVFISPSVPTGLNLIAGAGGKAAPREEPTLIPEIFGMGNDAVCPGERGIGGDILEIPGIAD